MATLQVETTALTDALEELHAAMAATFARHGEAALDLRRDILAWAKTATPVPDLVVLPGGVMAFIAPPEVPALLARARRLGVI